MQVGEWEKSEDGVPSVFSQTGRRRRTLGEWEATTRILQRRWRLQRRRFGGWGLWLAATEVGEGVKVKIWENEEGGVMFSLPADLPGIKNSVGNVFPPPREGKFCLPR
ncbi:hypothetical protein PIB30_037497 [Stylosanthes scabra]|uniref:Uncharacterized protein n=1 Tax=Stylosanthes scabra TaxID=79078 RepID=A0ABU6XFK2_9FABA|nr:hypothetical protein [Stylosanthes scabra]